MYGTFENMMHHIQITYRKLEASKVKDHMHLTG